MEVKFGSGAAAVNFRLRTSGLVALLCAYGVRTLWDTPSVWDELREFACTFLAPRLLGHLPSPPQWYHPFGLVSSFWERFC